MNEMGEVVELLKEAQGLLSGHFCLTSGLHSDTYFQCAKLYQYPDIVEKIAKELAQKLETLPFDTIVAPAIGAIIFGYEVAKQSGKRNLFVERNLSGRKVASGEGCVEHSERDSIPRQRKDGTMELRRGYTLKKGEKVVIIEDVITTARTIYETMDALKEFECEIVGVGCIVDRTQGKTGLNIVSVLKADPVVYKPEECPLCKEGIELVKPGSRVGA